MVREELFAGLCDKNSSPNVRSGYGSAWQGPDLELLFPNFSASSIPLIIIVAVSNRLNPSIGRIRCLMRR
jgi:hypothetical protein